MSANPAADPVRAHRPEIVGPDDGPEAPYPIRLEGPIVKGFGRGSRELGIPTANIPIDTATVAGREDITSGIYYGWAGLYAPADVHGSARLETESSVATAPSLPSTTAVAASDTTNDEHHAVTYPMVMSVGWNPFYENEKRSVEIHLLAHFPTDFYGAHIRLLILGFIRPELNYTSKEALIEDIRTDIAVARRSLDREGYRRWMDDRWLVEGRET